MQTDAWTESDVAMKKREDALRNARNEEEPLSKVRKVVPDDGILEDVPWSMLAEEPPYDKEAHAVYRGTLAKFQAKQPVTVDGIDAALKRLPAPFDRPGFFTDPAAGKGFVLCGGAALAMVQKDSAPAADVDLFWIGGSEFAPWQEAVKRVINMLLDMYTKENVVLTRTQYAITAACHRYDPSEDWYSTNKGAPVAQPLVVQFVARSYGSIADVLVGFDLDACAVAYDGTIKALPRAIRALRWQANLVDVDRQSETFEQRLVKYATKKGFDIIVPCVDLRKVNWYQICGSSDDNDSHRHGLLALLRMTIKKSATAPTSNYSECGYGLNLTKECRFPFSAFATYTRVKYPLGFVSSLGASVRSDYRGRCGYYIEPEYIRGKKAPPMAERIFGPLANISGDAEDAKDDLPALTELVEGHCGCFRPTSVDWFVGC